MEAGIRAPGEEAPVRSGTMAERYQVILLVGPATLREEYEVLSGGAGSTNHANLSELEPGIRVSAEPRSARRSQTSRRLCCDASTARLTRVADGETLDFGRRTRTIPPALRRALEVRDLGCRFPGCSSRFCDAHHIRHWAHVGETSLSNALLLCRQHHRPVHEGGWTLGLSTTGHPIFRNPRGETVMSHRSRPIRNGKAREPSR